MLKRAFLLDKPEDYKRLGINPNRIEEWEDGVRDNAEPNHFEWWYFDSMLDDGTKVVVQFLSKQGRSIKKAEFSPTLFFKVTTPDGKQIDKEYSFDMKDVSWSKDTCYVKFGPNTFSGNLKEYKIHMDLVDGMAADIVLSSKSTPYRPGTSYFQFEDEDKYYTWLCVVPKGDVSGTLTVNGKTKEISGSGYHDHQWGSINFHKYWNHWLWARQSFEDYSMLVFDFFISEEFGYERLPIIFIQNKEGEIVFENSHEITSRVEKHYLDDASGKEYPSKIHYEFTNEGAKVIYDLEAVDTLEKKGMKTMALPMKMAMKAMGIQPSYSRYVANGNLQLTTEKDNLHREGQLIYEIMFPGTSCVEMMNS